MDFVTFYDRNFNVILLFLFLILIVNALLAVIPASIAREKGRDFGSVWALSFFTTIFVGLLVVIAFPQERPLRALRTDASGKVLVDETEIPETLKCPFCVEMVKADASICRYCQKDISKHISAIKSQIEKNIAAKADEAAARQRKLESQAEARRGRRVKLFRNTWFRLSVLGGILALAAAVPAIMDASRLAAASGTLAGIQSAADACESGSAITYHSSEFTMVKISMEKTPDIAECVVKSISGQGLSSLNLTPNGATKTANGYEFELRGEFISIFPQD